MKVRDVMTRQVVTARPEMSLRDLALLLSEHRISGMPVLDAAGSVIGIVSEADILAKERGHAPVHGSGLSWLFGERRAPDERKIQDGRERVRRLEVRSAAIFGAGGELPQRPRRKDRGAGCESPKDRLPRLIVKSPSDREPANEKCRVKCRRRGVCRARERV